MVGDGGGLETENPAFAGRGENGKAATGACAGCRSWWSRRLCSRNDMPCRCGADDDCGCGHGAAYQYKSSTACFAFHYGEGESSSGILSSFRNTGSTVSCMSGLISLKRAAKTSAFSLPIVDAIDTLAPKCYLIAEALKRHIKIVSSMGAGAKSDITQIRFADIWDTYHCGLSKAVRKRLQKLGIKRKLPVVFSTEQADPKAVLLTEDEQNKKSTCGTVSYMPAV